MRRTPRVVSAAFLLALTAAGCGSSAGGVPPRAQPSIEPTRTVTDPVTIASEALPLDLDERIVPVDGDLAEIVFALGFGDQVVATDISATYPAEADALPEVGYQRALAPEPILAFEPTLVLATDLAGPTETLDALDRLDVETIVIERDSSPLGPGNKIRSVAAAIGAHEAGADLAAEVDAQITAATERASLAPTSPRIGIVYLRGDNVQLLFGEGSGVDWLIDAVGGIDIADELGVVDNAPINAEALVVAAPDVLIVPQRGLDSVGGLDGLLDVAGIGATPAAQNGRILVYDDQLLLGNGPRTGEFLDQLITDLYGDI